MKALKQFFKGFSEGMKGFGSSISAIINSVLLLVVYLIGIGLTSIFARIFRKRFLAMKIFSKKPSYWSDLGLKKRPIDEYYRQF